jgi:hypothetical protein
MSIEISNRYIINGNDFQLIEFFDRPTLNTLNSLGTPK